MSSINPPSFVSFKPPLVWKKDVYALGRNQGGDGKLFKYSVSSNMWSDFSVPSSIYTSNSVLLTYCSKLLLISGENMTLWEFSSNDFTFKQSCIKPIPPQHNFNDFIATSKGEYLIIMWYIKHLRPISFLFYDGRDWNYRQYELTGRFHSGYCCNVILDSHAIVVIASPQWDKVNVVRVQKAPILRFSEDKDENCSCAYTELEIISFAEFDRLICRRNYSAILHNQQIYFVDSQGIIFTSFIQSPILPLVWGNSGVHFQQALYMVGLPDGIMLMIGMVEHQDGSQLDIIKVSQKGNRLSSVVFAKLFWNPGVILLIKMGACCHSHV